ncbi:MAG: hypothetical protein ACJ75F_07470 [Flavisolibacter sp.]|jgi:hypothetical protein
MLTKDEEDFLRYWSDQRTRKKQFYRKLSIGLPLGALIVVAIMVNMLSGWYKKADMEIHRDSSLVLVVLIAGIAIIIFISVFSVRHKWDQNELHYQELLQKKDQSA